MFDELHLPNDATINKPHYFIAMEYKGFSNCIYQIFITDSLIMGAKVNGYITVESNFGIGTSVPKNIMHDPEAYVKNDMQFKYTDILVDSNKFMNADKANFVIEKKDVKDIFNNRRKKWGMGYYPQSGRITIQTIKTVYNGSKKRDLILIGDQNPDEILEKLGFKTR
jgi:hypothetical protein